VVNEKRNAIVEKRFVEKSELRDADKNKKLNYIKSKYYIYVIIKMIKISNPTQFRNNVREKIETQFSIENKNSAINLEKGVYNFAIKEANSRKIIKKWENSRFVQLYTDRLRTICINLKNSELLQSLNSGEITPQQLAFMTHQEMDPEHWRKWIEQKAMRDANKFTNNIQASTDMFTCKKCKGKRCTYYELQTRSADEPATIFVTCLDCGKNWKS